MKRLFLLLTAIMCVATSYASLRYAQLDLNGEWEYGSRRNYTATVRVPGIPDSADRPADGRVWYRRSVTLPDGAWSDAALELKGARFRPEVYVDGRLVSAQEGGMIRSLHFLHHPSLRPGYTVTIEISLASLADVPPTDASFIPKVDQWRSNCSSSLWDDAVLHLYTGSFTDRVLTDCDTDAKRLTLRYRVCGEGAASARLTISGGNEPLVMTSTASEGENSVQIDYGSLLKEWSPEHPHLYELVVELFDEQGETLHRHRQSLGLRRAAVEKKQFTLNGRPLKLRGGTVVWHRWMRDAESREVGYDTLWFRDNIVRRLKSHGANLLRFHLGAPPERLLDLCDRYGLAVQFEWNFFHGMPATRESLMEQYPKWFDLASRHPCVILYHPYNETEGEEQLQTVWSALNEITAGYPPLILEDRDVTHIHKYWWSLFENLGLYYDSYEQFDRAIMVDEFGGNYLDGEGNMGGYPSIRESYMRFLGRSHTAADRLHHLDRSCGKVAEYWRRIGAAGIAPFTIASSYADGNHWFMGPLRNGEPKSVWDALTVLWSPQAASMDIWDVDFTPREQVELPLHFFNDTDTAAQFSARVEILGVDDEVFGTQDVTCNVDAYSKQIVHCPIVMPEACGDYLLRTTLTTPVEGVVRPVVSEWEVCVIRAAVPDAVKCSRLFIPTDETELQALARQLHLKLTHRASAADVLLLGRTSWEHFDRLRTTVEQAIEKGASVVMLDIGERYLGQGYPTERGELGPLQGVTKVRNPIITHYDLFGGLSLTCTEMAEPESHIHPDTLHTELWRRLTPRHTALWNGLRGGLMVPAADFEVQGLSREAFSAQWSRRGADIERMAGGDWYAYELSGFFAYDSLPDSKETIRRLREKVEFLVEDAPALAISINPKAPVRITDLGEGFRRSLDGSAAALIPLASAGKNLTRTPVMRIGFGEGRGTLLLSGLLTDGRLDARRPADTTHPFAIKYDEAAVQTVLELVAIACEHAPRTAKKERGGRN